ncbi:MAG: pitrilysin family protein [Blastomonas sp.]
MIKPTLRAAALSTLLLCTACASPFYNVGDVSEAPPPPKAPRVAEAPVPKPAPVASRPAPAPAAAPVAMAETPSAPAPVGDLVAAVDIPYETFTLSNGLEVIVHEDRKAPVVAVSIWYGVGSKHEPAGKTGYAHLFEHIMFNGSENAKGDYFEYLKVLGATDYNGTTWLDRTNYFQTVPRPALEGALFLESDRMGYLLGGLNKEKLDNQIGVVSNEKRQGDNQPYGLVEYEQVRMLLPESHPYGHSTIGSLEDLKAASLDDMKSWFTDHYGPNNAVLVLAGDIDADEARPLVEKWFGDIPRGPEVPKISPGIPELQVKDQVVLKDQVPTTRIYRNWLVPGLNDADYTAIDVGATVLGGLASSRLDNIMVRKEQNAVAVTAYVLPFVHASILEVYVDVKPGEDADAVALRLDEIIADFIANGPTADEVQRVATRDAANRITGLEQVGGFGGKAVALAEGALYSDDPDHYKKELERLAAMTPAKVTAAMQKWLSRPPARLRVVPGERDAYQDVTGGGGRRTGVLGGAARYFDQESWGGLGSATGGASAEEAADAAAEAAADAAEAAAETAGPADRATMPLPKSTPDLDFPDVQRAILSNGIVVRFARRTAVPVVRVSVDFDAGYASDPKDALGTNSFMTTMLEEGTTSMDSVALAEAQERLGANIGAGSGLDRTSISLTAMKPNLSASLDLLADVIRNPAFDPAEVERIRVRQITRIKAEGTQPQGIALRNLPPLIYGESHPYGVPFTGTGSADVVAKLTRDQLVAYHRQWIRPERAEIYVVGDTTLEEIVPMLDARFGRWPTNRMALQEKNFAVATPAQDGRIIIINRPNSPQSLILAGEALEAKGTDDILALEAANEVLGGDFLSRMNMDLRETKGWSYGVRSLIQRPQQKIPFIIFAPVQTNQTGPSVQALLDQLNGFIGDNGITAEELQRMIASNTLEQAGNFERSANVMGQMKADVLYGRPSDYAESVADRYRALTADKVDMAMRSAVNPKGLTWLIVGDAAKIKGQLEKIGLPIEVRELEGGGDD